MKQAAVIAVLLSLSVGAATGVSASASTSFIDARKLFNDEAHGFKGEVKLTCQAKGDEVVDTILAIVTAATNESRMSLLTNSLKFAYIGPPFINECGSYMKDDEKEVLTALVNFASSFIEEEEDDS